MITIAICNQKGGVGKSTTTFHLARTATLAGLRVLVVDADPQGNITAALARDDLPDDLPGLADALSARSDETLATIIVPTIWESVLLAPTIGDTLAVVRDELVLAGAGREARLAVELAGVDDNFDLTLIDCPPSLDQLTINALTAADRVLVVSQSKQWSASGLAHLMHTVHAVQAHYNPHLTVAGILVNHHDAQTTSGAHWLADLTTYASGAGLTVFEPPMPKRVVIADAVESSLGLDQYPGAPADLAAHYATYLKEITA